MKYAKTISRKIGSWEVIRCYQLRGKELKLEKWGVKRYWEPEEKFIFYDIWEDVLDHMEEHLDNQKNKIKLY
jgi:hypothetical protein